MTCFARALVLDLLAKQHAAASIKGFSDHPALELSDHSFAEAFSELVRTGLVDEAVSGRADCLTPAGLAAAHEATQFALSDEHA